MIEASARELEVVVFGATGYTGRLVAEYLARRAGDQRLRWGIAGRDRNKLEAVRAGLPASGAVPDSPEVLVADVTDPGSLRAMAERCAVLCTTVGPYARYGSAVVAACVEAGTDYCDITGEVPWIRQMIDRHHEAAARRGVRIVHCCGYDSIPSELGTLVLQERALELFGAPCREVAYHAGESRGGFSGGTVASMLGLVEAARRDPELRRLLADPYALNPEGERQGPDTGDQRGVRWSPELGRWTGPFVMAAINTRVVRRGHALRGYPWGRDFRYSEAMALGSGPRGALMAAGLAGGLAAFVGLAAFPPTRRLLQATVLPEPGEGPSAASRERGFFRSYLVGRGITPEGRKFEVRGRVEGTSDPGYGETAKMLGESALCLVRDRPLLPGLAGVLTPASALGLPLVARLRDAGMTFEAEAR